ncbi:nepI [Symbiodinium microadriaticum]|nr:nepI [Symbiodinium microadriaticum]
MYSSRYVIYIHTYIHTYLHTYIHTYIHTSAQGLAGFLGATAGWRAPFALVGAAGLGITLLLFVLQKEPNKIEEADLDEPSNYCTSLCSALARPTVILTCLQGIFGCVPWAVIGTFLADFLATNANMGVPGATTVLFSFGVGCFTGTAIGGKLGQHLYRRDKRLQAWLMGLTVWGGMLPFMFLFSSAGSWGHPVLFYILALAGGILAPIAGSNAKAVLLNTVATRSRGTVFGVYNIMDDLGKGLGPALVSSWVRRLGRRDSFMLGIAFWAPCGLFCVLMTKTITSDDLSARTLPEVPSREAIKFEDESPETAEGSFEGSSLTSQSSTKSKSPDSPSKLTSKRAQTIGHPYRETLSFSDDNS